MLENEKNGDLGNAWLTTHAAGSGPFQLDDWRASGFALDESFRRLLARRVFKLRRVIVRHMTESQSMRLMLDKGDIDLAVGMSVPDVEAMKKNPNVVIESVKRGTLYYVAVSVKDPKFADKRVRQAIRNLIDYDGINKTVMPNYGIYHQRPQLGLPATLPNPGYKLDVAAAKNCWPKPVSPTASRPRSACCPIRPSSILRPICKLRSPRRVSKPA